MTENKRVKLLINWLISQGVVSSQQDLGEKMGITNKSYMSQLVNGKASNENFLDKLSKFDERINRVWLLTGEGDMLINASTIQADDNTATATNGSTAVAGNGNSVTSSADLSIALEEIAAQRRLTESALTLSTKLQDQASKNQQQIDRLLTIIEHLQK